MAEMSNWVSKLPAQRLLAIAERLKEKKRAAAGGREIRPVPRPLGKVPLSFAQERLWFLDQLEPGTAFYNIPGASRLLGPVRLGALAAALEALVARHESLRTTFGDAAGRPYQIVSPPQPVELPLIDLAGLAADGREREIERLAGTATRRPFDLARGPLLRVLLYRISPTDHAVVYTLHHIISDGWSQLVFMREVAALYDAFSAGLPSPLPPLAIQYPDYAVWQRGYLSGAVLESHLAYWRERLAGSAGLELPPDRPRPPVETFRGHAWPVALSPALSRAVNELARREGATLFMVLLAGFKALLHRYTGQAEIPIGSPIANRTHRDIEGVIGFFSNTIVLRTDLGGDPTFRQLLGRVREVTLGAYAHEDLPFERVVEEVQPERDMSRNPLFQIMCVLQNQPRRELPAGELTMAGMAVGLKAAKFDLTIFWHEDGDGVNGQIEHNTDLFDSSTIARFFAHLEALFAAATADPDRPVGAYPLLAEAERHQMLREWNETAAASALPAVCVHRWVEEQAARTPTATAATFAGERLTYAELNARANRMAHALRRRGVGPERLVGICVERSLEMTIAALAVLKAGGALVALDPAYPRERLATIIEDAGLAVLLTEDALLQHFPRHAGIALCLGRGEQFPEESAADPASGVEPDNPMYVIYTSGSTGQPKGIVVPHRAFANLLAWQLRGSPLAGRARTVQFSTFGFCVSFQEIFSAWCSGGTLVVASEMTRRDVEGLPAFLEAEEVERLHLPFAALKHLADAAGEAASLPARLKEVITAGEQLQVTPSVRRLFERLPGCSLHNQYGASETHVVAALTLAGAPGGWPAIPTVGRPIANVRIHLLDARLEPVPVGVRGELYAAGACVARGYLNDPVLTAQKMVPDPYAGEAGARLYRTGDLARHLADGTIEYLGRIDGQIKVRGFRVELGEIETMLARHPGVRDAAVVAVPGPAQSKRLVAYVVPEAPRAVQIDAPGALQLDALRLYLKRALPEYMVPAFFVPLAGLPLNANGKLDQAALPPPETGEGAGGGAAYVAPRTPAEEMLAGLWAELLGLPRVGAGDSFFELGGHSLLVTQLVSRIRGAFGIELPLRRLFELPVLSDLARAIEAQVAQQQGQASAAPPLGPQPREGDPPLSFAQERLWFLDRLEPGKPFYNMPIALRLRGPLNLAALAASHLAVVARHETLRTTFAEVDGRPVQVIAPPAGSAASSAAGAPALLDLTALPAARREREAQALAGREAARPFDLARGPLVRATLVALAPDDHAALFTMHHIVSDGWSLGVLVRELGTLYAALASGRARSGAAILSPLALQYADFALWQRGWLAGDVLAEQIAYWRGSLAGAPPVLELPLDRPRPPVQTFRGAAVPFFVEGDLARRWNALGRGRGTTLFMSLLAAFAALLSRISGQDDVVVGSPVANRTHREIEDLIGFFVNTLALRTRLAGDPDFAALAGRVREATLGAYAHQDLPFERLVEELSPERSLAISPLFQVMFVLQNAPIGALELAGLTLETAASEGSRTAKFDLSLMVTEGAGGLAGHWERNVDLFDAATIERFDGWFRAVLAGWTERPAARLSELPLLSESERRQLAEWGSGGTSGDAPVPASGAALQDGFFAWAARRPEAEALIWGEERVSYGELAARASRLAQHLVELGVGPETLVGVCLPRSPELVAALLAVLAAGGAYVPLDPAYPPERLGFMLEDTRAPLAIGWTGGPELGRPTLRLDDPEEAAAIARQSAAPLAPRALPGNLAYVLYTSGSTGRPKGVAIEHRSVLAFFAWAAPLFVQDIGVEGSGAILAGTSIAFDVSVFELFFTLAHGGRIVLAENSLALPRLPAVGEVTLLNAVPSAVAELLREGGVPPSVRTINLPGEPLGSKLVEAVYATGHVERVFNLYGPSEDTTYSTIALVPPGGEREPSIGRPIAGTRAHVLDPWFQPALPGVVGELFLAGAGLARGYFGRPELTAERFVPDPFGEPGSRLYTTGDLVRYRVSGDSAGELEFLGRRDHQVKLRGFRIELGEVEAALAAQPGIEDSAVVLRRGASGEPELAAFYTARPPAEGGDAPDAPDAPEAPDVAGLRAALGRRLPGHMVPAAWILLPELPLNPNGKVDRRALARMEIGAGARPRGERVAPRDGVELALARIWEELLGRPEVSVTESFFELGGHSLLAVRLMARLARRFGRELPLATLFRAPTIERLAAVLRREGTGEAWSPLVPLAAGPGPEAETAAGTPPFFCVHPIGGAVFCYRELARRLAVDRPFYALQARGLAEGEAPFARIEEMATVYREAIVAVQPAGPYHLGGWSFGALIALEIASQLRARGEAVALLALIDPTTLTAAERALPVDDLSSLLVVARDIAGMTGRPLDLAVDELAPLAPEARLDLVLARALAAGGLPPDADPAQLRRLVGLYHTHVQAIRAYELPPHDGPIALFRAADGPLADRMDAWHAVAAGGLDVRVLPGGHYDLLRAPQIEALAEGLRACLAGGG